MDAKKAGAQRVRDCKLQSAKSSVAIVGEEILIDAGEDESTMSDECFESEEEEEEEGKAGSSVMNCQIRGTLEDIIVPAKCFAHPFAKNCKSPTDINQPPQSTPFKADTAKIAGLRSAETEIGGSVSEVEEPVEVTRDSSGGTIELLTAKLNTEIQFSDETDSSSDDEAEATISSVNQFEKTVFDEITEQTLDSQVGDLVLPITKTFAQTAKAYGTPGDMLTNCQMV